MCIIKYFEEVETMREYCGYFCSVGEAMSLLISGSLCELRNVSQIHQWAESARVSAFLKGHFGIARIPSYYWLPPDAAELHVLGDLQPVEYVAEKLQLRLGEVGENIPKILKVALVLCAPYGRGCRRTLPEDIPAHLELPLFSSS